MKIYRVHSANYRRGGRSLQRTGGAWITKPLTNWKKATQNMKSHSKSEVHLLSCQLDVEADRARKEGYIISQFQNVGEHQKWQNRKVIDALMRCTHFLAHQHIVHTTNLDKLVELVVSCGGEILQLPWQSWRKCNVHLKNGCSWVCECSLNMGGRVST